MNTELYPKFTIGSVEYSDWYFLWYVYMGAIYVAVRLMLQCSDDTFAAGDRDKANMLNDFFATCWNTSQPPSN